MRLGLILAFLLAFLSPAHGFDPHTFELFLQSDRGQHYTRHGLAYSFIDDPEWADATADPRFAKAFEHFKAGNFGDAARALPALAEEGHAKAQLLMGILHYQGHGVEKSFDQAMDWTQQAVEQDLLAAKVALAQIYFDIRQEELGSQMLERAAEGGDSLSQIFLAFIYQGGFYGLPLDEVKAFEWFLKAAEAGEPFAIGQVASGYYLGARRKSDGAVVKRDFIEAIRWAFAAAERNDAVGQFLIGTFYTIETQISRRPDWEKGVVWYRRAAEQGHLVAQIRLSVAYQLGEGVPRDLVTAYKWAMLAERDSPYSVRDSKLASEMTPEQIAEGEKRALEWMEERGLILVTP